MPRTVPKVTSDEEAEAFLDQDLSDLDLAPFRPVLFEFERKAAQLNMRLPPALLAAGKERARARGIPYTRFVREVLELAVCPRHESGRSLGPRENDTEGR
jgi:predicted DNA binding CopG/RHH family protein